MTVGGCAWSIYPQRRDTRPAYRQSVKNFPFYNQAYQFFETTWLAQ
jgi:hypothetical protein